VFPSLLDVAADQQTPIPQPRSVPDPSVRITALSARITALSVCITALSVPAAALPA